MINVTDCLMELSAAGREDLAVFLDGEIKSLIDCRLCRSWGGKHCTRTTQCFDADLFVRSNHRVATWKVREA